MSEPVQLAVKPDAVPNAEIEVMDVVYEVWGTGRGPGQNIREMVTIRFL